MNARFGRQRKTLAAEPRIIGVICSQRKIMSAKLSAQIVTVKIVFGAELG
jgi:hypothetical protein